MSLTSLVRGDLIRDEGLRLKPYHDSKGILTIGVGRNLESVGISRQEAMILLGNDVRRSVNGLNRRAPVWKTLDPVRREVLINMCFNMGIGSLMKFRKMWAAIEEGDFPLAAYEMSDSKWRREDVSPKRSSRLIFEMKEGRRF